MVTYRGRQTLTSNGAVANSAEEASVEVAATMSPEEMTIREANGIRTKLRGS